MIDYVALLLTNMVSGLLVLAFFLWRNPGREEAGHWAPVFGITGLVATVAGFAMAFTWPIPAPFSEIYGQTSVLLGVLFLGAAWALARGWSLLPLGIYAFFAGGIAILIGVRFIDLALTPASFLPGAGFILTGLGGLGGRDRAVEARGERTAGGGRPGDVSRSRDLGLHRLHGLLDPHEGPAGRAGGHNPGFRPRHLRSERRSRRVTRPWHPACPSISSGPPAPQVRQLTHDPHLVEADHHHARPGHE